MKSLELKDGNMIPQLGFGTWQMTGEECAAAVETALQAGYRHLDTADRYGNHTDVAAGMKRTGLPREDIYLTTKIFPGDFTADRVHAKIDEYLQELETDYIDLLLLHWPDHSVPISETLQALDEAKTTGKIRSYGVSNFTENHMADALDTGYEFVVNQVEMHPGFPQHKIRSFCRDNGIVVTAYSPLGRGEAVDLELIKTLAEKYEKTPGQIILNWLLSIDVVTVPKSANPDRIKENLAAADFTLDPADVDAIDALNTGERIIEPEFAHFDY
jgi:diketogulonate reductase-like aldo/keto reductase